MRLIGYSLRRRPFFNRGLYLPLGELTVLLGANDAGKSTLLRALAADLGGRPLNELEGEGFALYFSVEDRELPLLSNTRPASAADRGIFDLWSHGGYDAQRASARDEDEETMQAHLRALREAATSEGFDRVIEALASSRTVCVHPPTSERGRSWHAYWCLPPLADLHSDVREAVERSDLHRFKRVRAEAAGEEFRRPGMLGGRPALWLELDEAPVTVAPLGAFPFPLPRPLAVPAASSELRRTIVDALISTVNVTRWGLQDAWGYELDENDAAARQGVKVLLDRGEDGAVRPAPTALGALSLLTATARAQLPEFVSSRYRLNIRLREIESWFEHEPLELTLQPVSDSLPVARFDLDDVADGLKLWLQLALLSGVDMLEQLQTALSRLADNQGYEEQLAQQSYEDEPPPTEDVFGEAVNALESLGPDARPELPGAVGDEEIYQQLPYQRLGLQIPGRVLLADEPEQHLNPRLQRRAARWLAELAAGGESPCIAASHSNAFLSLPPGPQMVHVRRGVAGIELRPFDVHAARELDDVADELGFDRGELLAGVSCLLLVEGEHEIAVLEEIFGRELAEAKVALVALRGSPPKGLLEVDALWRFTTAAVAVCLDNVRPELVTRAQAGDDEALRALRRSDAEEEKALARLITQSQRFAREIHLLGHPGVDLIDALEPTAIRQVYPKYPESHETADDAYRAAAGEAEKGDEPKPNRKAFYQEHYGIENSRRAYEQVGAAHRELGLRPAALEEIVERAAQAGAAADLEALTWRDACQVTSVEGPGICGRFSLGAAGAGTGEGSASSTSESG